MPTQRLYRRCRFCRKPATFPGLLCIRHHICYVLGVGRDAGGAWDVETRRRVEIQEALEIYLPIDPATVEVPVERSRDYPFQVWGTLSFSEEYGVPGQQLNATPPRRQRNHNLINRYQWRAEGMSRHGDFYAEHISDEADEIGLEEILRWVGAQNAMQITEIHRMLLKTTYQKRGDKINPTGLTYKAIIDGKTLAKTFSDGMPVPKGIRRIASAVFAKGIEPAPAQGQPSLFGAKKKKTTSELIEELRERSLRSGVAAIAPPRYRPGAVIPPPETISNDQMETLRAEMYAEQMRARAWTDNTVGISYEWQGTQYINTPITQGPSAPFTVSTSTAENPDPWRIAPIFDDDEIPF